MQGVNVEILITILFFLVVYLLITQSIKRDELLRQSLFERIEYNNKEIERLLCQIKKQNYQITTAFHVSNEDEPK